MRRQAPPPQASLRATGPTLETSGQVHRIPGVVSGETEAFPATQRTARFPVDHTIQQLCHPRTGRVPREDLRTWGLGGGPAKVPRQVERVWAGRTIALGPVLLWCLRPGPSPGGYESCFGSNSPPCPEVAILAREASTLKSVLPTRDGTVTPATSVSQSSKPLSVNAGAASCPWCPQKAFTCGKPGPGLAGPGPMAGAWGGHWSHGGRGWGVCLGISRGPGPLSRPGVAHAIP